MRKLSLLGATSTVLVCLLWTGIANAVSVNHISNGTFDDDLSFWDTGGTLGVTWVEGEASVGQPGTLGSSFLGQSFGPVTAPELLVEFDYQWQSSAPTIPDTFTVKLIDAASDYIDVLVQDSDESGLVFNSSYAFSQIVSLAGLNTADPLTIQFHLKERNASGGTRIRLDNVAVSPFPGASPVPLPAAAWLFGSALVVFLTGSRRRCRNG